MQYGTIHDIFYYYFVHLITYTNHIPRASIATQQTNSGTCHTLRRCSTIRDSWPLSMPLPIRYGSHTVHEVENDKVILTIFIKSK